MLTTGEWCDPVSKMSYRVKRVLSGHERFEDSRSVLTRLQRSPKRKTVEEIGVVSRRTRTDIGTCPLLVTSYDM